MQLYRLKLDDWAINWKFINDSDESNDFTYTITDIFHTPVDTYGSNLEDFRCKSLSDLKSALFEYLVEGFDMYNNDDKISNITDAVLNKIGYELFEFNYPDSPCIIVQCDELDDQFECTADRIPTLYLKSTKELETLKLDYYYEVYIINKDGTLELDEKLGTFKF